MKKNRWSFRLIITVFLFSLLVSSNVFASIEDDMARQVVDIYNKAKLAKGVSSFVNICPSATGYQMITLGLITKGVQTDYPNSNADGKNWYPFYLAQNGNLNSKGYRTVCASGADCLQTLVNSYGMPLYNIVVSYGPYGGNNAGHVMLIHAIINNKVYFTDNFQYGSSAEGDVRIWSIDEFNQRYRLYNGDPLGAVYFQKQEAAVSGWIQVNGFWKYGNGNGTYVIGWLRDNGNWYYFNNDGIMMTGWVQSEGLWYYCAQDGHMLTGKQYIDGDWYYFYEIGEMATGWLEIGENNYYFNFNGKMYRNKTAKIDGAEYQFDNNGIATLINHTKPIPPVDNGGGDIEIPETEPETELATKPEEKVIQYSYRTRTMFYEYMSSKSADLTGWECIDVVPDGQWGSWSSWSKNYMEGSDTVEVESRTVDIGTKTQIYLGRYYSAEKNKFSPDKLDGTYSFEGGWFDNTNVTYLGQVYSGGRTDCYKVPGYHYYFFEVGEFGGETRETSLGQTTEYRYREKTDEITYKYRRPKYSDWSDWSEWSNVPVKADDLKEVRSREVS